jgi:Na+-translocating ferredoxin:NAD+ oxidoreductase RnfD subunit
VAGLWDWGIPLIIICSGTFINFRFTSRLPLLSSWLIGFAIQAFLRHWLFGNALLPSLAPMTGLAFLLFTFYMVTDPPTTPSTTRGQIFFGLSVAFTYGALMALHVVFGLFFSLVIVCGVRGTVLALKPYLNRVVEGPGTDAAVAQRSG